MSAKEAKARLKINKLLEEAECSYDIAKAELEKSLQPRVLEHEGKDVKFRWAVTDFSEHLVHITVLGD